MGLTKMLPKEDVIRIVGANEHNLKNISVDIPRNKFLVHSSSVFLSFLTSQVHEYFITHSFFV